MDKVVDNKCPHCGERMKRWENPDSWDTEFQLVCFNDECEYFVRGWAWMDQRFRVSASYRFRFDPSTGETGPLPVWSKAALRANIIENGEGEATDAG